MIWDTPPIQPITPVARVWWRDYLPTHNPAECWIPSKARPKVPRWTGLPDTTFRRITYLMTFYEWPPRGKALFAWCENEECVNPYHQRLMTITERSVWKHKLRVDVREAYGAVKSPKYLAKLLDAPERIIDEILEEQWV
jgi:hypothetical protein